MKEILKIKININWSGIIKNFKNNYLYYRDWGYFNLIFLFSSDLFILFIHFFIFNKYI